MFKYFWVIVIIVIEFLCAYYIIDDIYFVYKHEKHKKIMDILLSLDESSYTIIFCHILILGALSLLFYMKG